MANEAVTNILSVLGGILEGVQEKDAKKAERGKSIKNYLQQTEIPRLRQELAAISPEDKEARQRLEMLIDQYQKFLTMDDQQVPEAFASLKLPTGTRVNDLATIFDMTKTFKKQETPTEAESAALAQATTTARKMALVESLLPDLTSIASSGRDTKGRQYSSETRDLAINLLEQVQSGQFDLKALKEFNPLVGFDIEEFLNLNPTEQARRILDAGWGTVDEDGNLKLSADAPVGLANAIKSGAIVPDFTSQKFQRLAQSEAFKKLQLENGKLAADIENIASATEVNQANVDRIKEEINRLQTLTPYEKQRLIAQVDNIKASTNVLEEQSKQVAATTAGLELRNERDRRTLESTIEKDNYLNRLAMDLGDEQLKQARASTLSAEGQAELVGLQVKLEKATFDSTVEERAARALSAKIDAYMKDAISPFSLAQAAINSAIDLPPEALAELPDEVLRKVGLSRETLATASRLGQAAKNSGIAKAAWGILDNAMRAAPPQSDRQFTLKALDEQLAALGIDDQNLRKGMLAIVEGAWNGIDTEASNAYLKTMAYVGSLRAQQGAGGGGMDIKDVNSLLNSLIDNESGRVGKMRDYLVAQGCASYISDLAVKYYPEKVPQSPESPGQTCADLIGSYRDSNTGLTALINIQRRLVLGTLGVDPNVGRPAPEAPAQAPAGPEGSTPPVQPATATPKTLDAFLGAFRDPMAKASVKNSITRLQEWNQNAGPDDPVPTWVNNLIVQLAKQSGWQPAEVAQAILGGGQ